MLSLASTSSFPIGDRQFWIVTAIAAAAALFILWRTLGGRLRRRGGKPRKTRAALTIGGKPVERKPKSHS